MIYIFCRIVNDKIKYSVPDPKQKSLFEKRSNIFLKTVLVEGVRLLLIFAVKCRITLWGLEYYVFYTKASNRTPSTIVDSMSLSSSNFQCFPNKMALEYTNRTKVLKLNKLELRINNLVMF